VGLHSLSIINLEWHGVNGVYIRLHTWVKESGQIDAEDAKLNNRLQSSSIIHATWRPMTLALTSSSFIYIAY